MCLKFLKHKKKEKEPKTYEGRFVSDDEIKEMVKPKKESFIQKEMKDINDMMETLRHYTD